MTVSPNVDEQAYVKQMRNVDPSYLPLYNPNPWSEGYLYVGDVGVIQSGTFRPLFNITMKATQRRNGGGVPENFEPLPFSPPSDTYTKSDLTLIKKLDPCCGDSHVVWSRVDDSTEGTIQEETEGDEGHHDKEYPRFSYKIAKTSPETSYVLLAMSDVEETVVEETQVEIWRSYMEKHHKFWLKFIRKKWRDPNFKAENLVLLCGVIKTSSWIIATLPGEGEYRLDVQDTPVGIQPTLTTGGKVVDRALRYGQDTPEGDREIMQHFAQLAGLNVPDSREPVRKRCLFIKGLRMEKDFWSPKRIVAAAEPQDPRPSDFDHPPPHTFAFKEQHDSLSSSRTRPEFVPQTAGHTVASESFATARPLPHSFPSLALSLEHIPRSLHLSSVTHELSLSTTIPIHAF